MRQRSRSDLRALRRRAAGIGMAEETVCAAQRLAKIHDAKVLGGAGRSLQALRVVSD